MTKKIVTLLTLIILASGGQASEATIEPHSQNCINSISPTLKELGINLDDLEKDKGKQEQFIKHAKETGKWDSFLSVCSEKANSLQGKKLDVPQGEECCATFMQFLCTCHCPVGDYCYCCEGGN